MKFEQLLTFLTINIFWSVKFLFQFFSKLLFAIKFEFAFLWRLSNTADGYWFLYSNKKYLHELRYVNIIR